MEIPNGSSNNNNNPSNPSNSYRGPDNIVLSTSAPPDGSLFVPSTSPKAHYDSVKMKYFMSLGMNRGQQQQQNSPSLLSTSYTNGTKPPHHSFSQSVPKSIISPSPIGNDPTTTNNNNNNNANNTTTSNNNNNTNSNSSSSQHHHHPPIPLHRERTKTTPPTSSIPVKMGLDDDELFVLDKEDLLPTPLTNNLNNLNIGGPIGHRKKRSVSSPMIFGMTTPVTIPSNIYNNYPNPTGNTHQPTSHYYPPPNYNNPRHQPHPQHTGFNQLDINNSNDNHNNNNNNTTDPNSNHHPSNSDNNSKQQQQQQQRKNSIHTISTTSSSKSNNTPTSHFGGFNDSDSDDSNSHQRDDEYDDEEEEENITLKYSPVRRTSLDKNMVSFIIDRTYIHTYIYIYVSITISISISTSTSISFCTSTLCICFYYLFTLVYLLFSRSSPTLIYCLCLCLCLCIYIYYC